jgi:hypothetical protein
MNLPAALDRYYRTAPIFDSNKFNKDWSVNEQVLTLSQSYIPDPPHDAAIRPIGILSLQRRSRPKK